MKKIALISLFTPTYNNVRGASALPYHLIYSIKERIELKIYSFNLNNIKSEDIHHIENSLHAKIQIIKLPKWIRLMLKTPLNAFRLFLKYPFITYLKVPNNIKKDIDEYGSDLIWVYGEEITRIANSFVNQSVIVSMPDCTSLYYYRLMGKPMEYNNFFSLWKTSAIYYKYLSFERDVFNSLQNRTSTLKYHFVGLEDSKYFKSINPNANVQFLRHPLYGHTEKNCFKFHFPIKILIAGQYNLYMKNSSDAFFLELTKTQSTSILKDSYSFTFLGKGWDFWNEKLQEVGYQSTHIDFALDYIEEITKHDIQLTPIYVGTGTKGKVLDAVSNGLLVIGTEGALENIALDNGKSCIIYNDVMECVSILKDIIKNTSVYEKMAENGYNKILESHNNETIATNLLDL